MSEIFKSFNDNTNLFSFNLKSKPRNKNIAFSIIVMILLFSSMTSIQSKTISLERNNYHIESISSLDNLGSEIEFSFKQTKTNPVKAVQITHNYVSPKVANGDNTANPVFYSVSSKTDDALNAENAIILTPSLVTEATTEELTVSFKVLIKLTTKISLEYFSSLKLTVAVLDEASSTNIDNSINVISNNKYDIHYLNPVLYIKEKEKSIEAKQLVFQVSDKKNFDANAIADILLLNLNLNKVKRTMFVYNGNITKLMNNKNKYSVSSSSEIPDYVIISLSDNYDLLNNGFSVIVQRYEVGGEIKASAVEELVGEFAHKRIYYDDFTSDVPVYDTTNTNESSSDDSSSISNDDAKTTYLASFYYDTTFESFTSNYNISVKYNIHHKTDTGKSDNINSKVYISNTDSLNSSVFPGTGLTSLINDSEYTIQLSTNKRFFVISLFLTTTDKANVNDIDYIDIFVFTPTYINTQYITTTNYKPTVLFVESNLILLSYKQNLYSSLEIYKDCLVVFSNLFKGFDYAYEGFSETKDNISSYTQEVLYVGEYSDIKKNKIWYYSLNPELVETDKTIYIYIYQKDINNETTNKGITSYPNISFPVEFKFLKSYTKTNIQSYNVANDSSFNSIITEQDSYVEVKFSKSSSYLFIPNIIFGDLSMKYEKLTSSNDLGSSMFNLIKDKSFSNKLDIRNSSILTNDSESDGSLLIKIVNTSNDIIIKSDIKYSSLVDFNIIKITELSDSNIPDYTLNYNNESSVINYAFRFNSVKEEKESLVNFLFTDSGDYSIIITKVGNNSDNNSDYVILMDGDNQYFLVPNNPITLTKSLTSSTENKYIIKNLINSDVLNIKIIRKTNANETYTKTITKVNQKEELVITDTSNPVQIIIPLNKDLIKNIDSDLSDAKDSIYKLFIDSDSHFSVCSVILDNSLNNSSKDKDTKIINTKYSDTDFDNCFNMNGKSKYYSQSFDFSKIHFSENTDNIDNLYLVSFIKSNNNSKINYSLSTVESITVHSNSISKFDLGFNTNTQLFFDTLTDVYKKIFVSLYFDLSNDTISNDLKSVALRVSINNKEVDYELSKYSNNEMLFELDREDVMSINFIDNESSDKKTDSMVSFLITMNESDNEGGIYSDFKNKLNKQQDLIISYDESTKILSWKDLITDDNKSNYSISYSPYILPYTTEVKSKIFNNYYSFYDNIEEFRSEAVKISSLTNITEVDLSKIENNYYIVYLLAEEVNTAVRRLYTFSYIQVYSDITKIEKFKTKEVEFIGNHNNLVQKYFFYYSFNKSTDTTEIKNNDSDISTIQILKDNDSCKFNVVSFNNESVNYSNKKIVDVSYNKKTSNDDKITVYFLLEVLVDQEDDKNIFDRVKCNLFLTVFSNDESKDNDDLTKIPLTNHGYSENYYYNNKNQIGFMLDTGIPGNSSNDNGIIDEIQACDLFIYYEDTSILDKIRFKLNNNEAIKELSNSELKVDSESKILSISFTKEKLNSNDNDVTTITGIPTSFILYKKSTNEDKYGNNFNKINLHCYNNDLKHMEIINEENEKGESSVKFYTINKTQVYNFTYQIRTDDYENWKTTDKLFLEQAVYTRFKDITGNSRNKILVKAKLIDNKDKITQETFNIPESKFDYDNNSGIMKFIPDRESETSTNTLLVFTLTFSQKLENPYTRIIISPRRALSTTSVIEYYNPKTTILPKHTLQTTCFSQKNLLEEFKAKTKIGINALKKDVSLLIFFNNSPFYNEIERENFNVQAEFQFYNKNVFYYDFSYDELNNNSYVCFSLQNNYYSDSYSSNKDASNKSVEFKMNLALDNREVVFIYNAMAEFEYLVDINKNPSNSDDSNDKSNNYTKYISIDVKNYIIDDEHDSSHNDDSMEIIAPTFLIYLSNSNLSLQKAIGTVQNMNDSLSKIYDLEYHDVSNNYEIITPKTDTKIVDKENSTCIYKIDNNSEDGAHREFSNLIIKKIVSEIDDYKVNSKEALLLSSSYNASVKIPFTSHGSYVYNIILIKGDLTDNENISVKINNYSTDETDNDNDSNNKDFSFNLKLGTESNGVVKRFLEDSYENITISYNKNATSNNDDTDKEFIILFYVYSNYDSESESLVIYKNLEQNTSIEIESDLTKITDINLAVKLNNYNNNINRIKISSTTNSISYISYIITNTMFFETNKNSENTNSFIYKSPLYQSSIINSTTNGTLQQKILSFDNIKDKTNTYLLLKLTPITTSRLQTTTTFKITYYSDTIETYTTNSFKDTSISKLKINEDQINSKEFIFDNSEKSKYCLFNFYNNNKNKDLLISMINPNTNESISYERNNGNDELSVSVNFEKDTDVLSSMKIIIYNNNIDFTNDSVYGKNKMKDIFFNIRSLEKKDQQMPVFADDKITLDYNETTNSISFENTITNTANLTNPKIIHEVYILNNKKQYNNISEFKLDEEATPYITLSQDLSTNSKTNTVNLSSVKSGLYSIYIISVEQTTGKLNLFYYNNNQNQNIIKINIKQTEITKIGTVTSNSFYTNNVTDTKTQTIYYEFKCKQLDLNASAIQISFGSSIDSSSNYFSSILNYRVVSAERKDINKKNSSIVVLDNSSSPKNEDIDNKNFSFMLVIDVYRMYYSEIYVDVAILSDENNLESSALEGSVVYLNSNSVFENYYYTKINSSSSESSSESASATSGSSSDTSDSSASIISRNDIIEEKNYLYKINFSLSQVILETYNKCEVQFYLPKNNSNKDDTELNDIDSISYSYTEDSVTKVNTIKNPSKYTYFVLDKISFSNYINNKSLITITKASISEYKNPIYINTICTNEDNYILIDSNLTNPTKTRNLIPLKSYNYAYLIPSFTEAEKLTPLDLTQSILLNLQSNLTSQSIDNKLLSYAKLSTLEELSLIFKNDKHINEETAQFRNQLNTPELIFKPEESSKEKNYLAITVITPSILELGQFSFILSVSPRIEPLTNLETSSIKKFDINFLNNKIFEIDTQKEMLNYSKLMFLVSSLGKNFENNNNDFNIKVVYGFNGFRISGFSYSVISESEFSFNKKSMFISDINLRKALNFKDNEFSIDDEFNTKYSNNGKIYIYVGISETAPVVEDFTLEIKATKDDLYLINSDLNKSGINLYGEYVDENYNNDFELSLILHKERKAVVTVDFTNMNYQSEYLLYSTYEEVNSNMNIILSYVKSKCSSLVEIGRAKYQVNEKDSAEEINAEPDIVEGKQIININDELYINGFNCLTITVENNENVNYENPVYTKLLFKELKNNKTKENNNSVDKDIYIMNENYAIYLNNKKQTFDIEIKEENVHDYLIVVENVIGDNDVTLTINNNSKNEKEEVVILKNNRKEIEIENRRKGYPQKESFTITLNRPSTEDNNETVILFKLLSSNILLKELTSNMISSDTENTGNGFYINLSNTEAIHAEDINDLSVLVNKLEIVSQLCEINIHSYQIVSSSLNYNKYKDVPCSKENTIKSIRNGYKKSFIEDFSLIANQFNKDTNIYVSLVVDLLNKSNRISTYHYKESVTIINPYFDTDNKDYDTIDSYHTISIDKTNFYSSLVLINYNNSKVKEENFLISLYSDSNVINNSKSDYIYFKLGEGKSKTYNKMNSNEIFYNFNDINNKNSNNNTHLPKRSVLEISSVNSNLNSNKILLKISSNDSNVLNNIEFNSISKDVKIEVDNNKDKSKKNIVKLSWTEFATKKNNNKNEDVVVSNVYYIYRLQSTYKTIVTQEKKEIKDDDDEDEDEDEATSDDDSSEEYITKTNLVDDTYVYTHIDFMENTIIPKSAFVAAVSDAKYEYEEQTIGSFTYYIIAVETNTGISTLYKPHHDVIISNNLLNLNSITTIEIDLTQNSSYFFTQKYKKSKEEEYGINVFNVDFNIEYILLKIIDEKNTEIFNYTSKNRNIYSRFIPANNDKEETEVTIQITIITKALTPKTSLNISYHSYVNSSENKTELILKPNQIFTFNNSQSFKTLKLPVDISAYKLNIYSSKPKLEKIEIFDKEKIVTKVINNKEIYEKNEKNYSSELIVNENQENYVYISLREEDIVQKSNFASEYEYYNYDGFYNFEIFISDYSENKNYEVYEFNKDGDLYINDFDNSLNMNIIIDLSNYQLTNPDESSSEDSILGTILFDTIISKVSACFSVSDKKLADIDNSDFDLDFETKCNNDVTSYFKKITFTKSKADRYLLLKLTFSDEISFNNRIKLRLLDSATILKIKQLDVIDTVYFNFSNGNPVSYIIKDNESLELLYDNNLAFFSNTEDTKIAISYNDIPTSDEIKEYLSIKKSHNIETIVDLNSQFITKPYLSQSLLLKNSKIIFTVFTNTQETRSSSLSFKATGDEYFQFNNIKEATETLSINYKIHKNSSKVIYMKNIKDSSVDYGILFKNIIEPSSIWYKTFLKVPGLTTMIDYSTKPEESFEIKNNFEIVSIIPTIEMIIVIKASDKLVLGELILSTIETGEAKKEDNLNNISNKRLLTTNTLNYANSTKQFVKLLPNNSIELNISTPTEDEVKYDIVLASEIYDEKIEERDSDNNISIKLDDSEMSHYLSPKEKQISIVNANTKKITLSNITKHNTTIIVLIKSASLLMFTNTDNIVVSGDDKKIEVSESEKITINAVLVKPGDYKNNYIRLIGNLTGNFASISYLYYEIDEITKQKNKLFINISDITINSVVIDNSKEFNLDLEDLDKDIYVIFSVKYTLSGHYNENIANSEKENIAINSQLSLNDTNNESCYNEVDPTNYYTISYHQFSDITLTDSKYFHTNFAYLNKRKIIIKKTDEAIKQPYLFITFIKNSNIMMRCSVSINQGDGEESKYIIESSDNNHLLKLKNKPIQEDVELNIRCNNSRYPVLINRNFVSESFKDVDVNLTPKNNNFKLEVETMLINYVNLYFTPDYFFLDKVKDASVRYLVMIDDGTESTFTAYDILTRSKEVRMSKVLLLDLSLRIPQYLLPPNRDYRVTLFASENGTKLLTAYRSISFIYYNDSSDTSTSDSTQSTDSKSSSKEDKDSDNTWWIVLLVILAFIIVIALVLICVKYFMNKRRQESESLTRNLMQNENIDDERYNSINNA